MMVGLKDERRVDLRVGWKVGKMAVKMVVKKGRKWAE